MKLKREKPEEMPFVSVVLPAAGSSTRMGGENKLLMEIDGMPVLAWTISAFERCALVKEIVITCREQDIVPYARLVEAYGYQKVKSIVRGGDTRTESVLRGICACDAECEIVAIHDGARPLISDQIIGDTICAAVKDGAAAPVVPMKDSVKRVENGRIVCDVPRDTIAAVQTPQVFRKQDIQKALQNALAQGAALTDDCAAAEREGIAVTAVAGSYENIKITTPEDIGIAESIIFRRDTK